MLNRRAESGFMGAMVAVMAVMTMLMVFLAVFPMAFEESDDDEIPMYFLDSVSVAGGKMIFGTDMEEFLKKEDIKGIKVILRPIGFDGTYSEMFGSSDSDEITVRTGILVIPVEDRTLNAEYEVAVWS